MKSSYKAPKGQQPGADVKSFPGAGMKSGSRVVKSAQSNLMKGATSNRPHKGQM